MEKIYIHDISFEIVQVFKGSCEVYKVISEGDFNVLKVGKKFKPGYNHSFMHVLKETKALKRLQDIEGLPKK